MSDNESSKEPSVPNHEDLLSNLDKVDNLLNRIYLHNLKSDFIAADFDEFNKPTENGEIERIVYANNIRALKVDRWVYDKEENIADKFKNIFSAFAEENLCVGMLFTRTKKGTDMYFVLKDGDIDLLGEAINGNFNGTKLCLMSPEKPDDLFIGGVKSIASVANIPSEKSEKFISQGIEKLLDGMVPQSDVDEYSVLILAEPVPHAGIQQIKNGYAEIATALTPFASHQFSTGTNDSKMDTEFSSASHSEGVNSSVSKTHGFNVGLGGSAGSSSSASKTSGWNAGLSFIATVTRNWGKTFTNATNMGIAPSVGYSYSRTKTEGKSKTDTDTRGRSYGVTRGTTENSTYSYKSYEIADLFEKLEAQIERMNSGQAIGMWKCASYILAKNAQTSINAANILRGLTGGDDSYIESAVVNEWYNRQHESEGTDFNNILKFVQHFTHPVFFNKYDLFLNKDDSSLYNVMAVTPTSNISTAELANTAAFPRNSISGLPVLQCARFGRDVITFDGVDGDLNIGKIYHMHYCEENKRVALNKQNLTAHTFITGSTKSGKSNTVFQLLNELCPPESEMKFLVIEPAKGEYKDVFGHRDDVAVYGTNFNFTDMLRINPFEFPSETHEIHILEHLDRLVEIFNVCWPMYAAMPAILKESIEKAYISAGWDLRKSQNKYNKRLFPTFNDVLREIRMVIKETEYSDELKGNYSGALVTRVKSLTTGLNGIIFTGNGLSNSELFEKNVIADLSRVASSETKALIMGILIMKLQEHRMSQGEHEVPLRHVTILEEAHNLLKRTPAEQYSESANLLGKSVEMLSNSIAEMRTYGEGFVIVDQSPGLLDMSVIRNTNTKIILRLPDFSDRELVGKAAGLNDEQITELSKLQLGVAAVYQNDWLAPVLCKFEEFKFEKIPYINPCEVKFDNDEAKSVLEFIMNHKFPQNTDKIDCLKLTENVIVSSLDAGIKALFLDYISGGDGELREKSGRLIHALSNAEKAISASKSIENIDEWKKSVLDSLNTDLSGYPKKQIELALALILHEQALRDAAFENRFIQYISALKGGVL